MTKAGFCVKQNYTGHTTMLLARAKEGNRGPMFTWSWVYDSVFGQPQTMRVIVDTPSLERLPPYLVSQLDVKLTPQSVRIYQTDAGEITPRPA